LKGVLMMLLAGLGELFRKFARRSLCSQESEEKNT